MTRVQSRAEKVRNVGRVLATAHVLRTMGWTVSFLMEATKEGRRRVRHETATKEGVQFMAIGGLGPSIQHVMSPVEEGNNAAFDSATLHLQRMLVSIVS